jgi:uncharacterized protein YggE
MMTPKFTFLIAALMASSLHAQSIDTKPFVQTTATVDTLVQPNKIVLSIYLREADLRGRASVESLEKDMVKVLEAHGVDLGEQLHLVDLGSDFRTQVFKRLDILKSKRYELELVSAKDASIILRALEAEGISGVDLVNVAYDDPEELRMAMRSKAALQAKAQAAALVDPLGNTVGAPLSLIEERYYNAVYSRNARAKTSLQELEEVDYTPPSVEFEPIKFTLTLNAKFEIR